MNKEIELTIKLKELGVKVKFSSPHVHVYLEGEKNTGIAFTPSYELRGNDCFLWTIESCLTWLREKEYGGSLAWGIDYSRISIKNNDYTFEEIITVKASQELQGLLECMLKIAGGE